LNRLLISGFRLTYLALDRDSFDVSLFHRLGKIDMMPAAASIFSSGFAIISSDRDRKGYTLAVCLNFADVYEFIAVVCFNPNLH
jgi:hypothetical protein